MNETNSPLPQPSGVTCPNCGAAQATSVAYCANCGAPLPPAKSSNSLALAVKIIVGLALFLGSLGLGALGACVLLIGGMSGGSSATDVAAGSSVFFVFAVLLAVMGVGWVVFWLTKKK